VISAPSMKDHTSGRSISMTSSGAFAAMIRQVVLAEACIARPLILHAYPDIPKGGSPMKGATMTVTMEKLGITASYSRPRVSNDNLFLVRKRLMA